MNEFRPTDAVREKGQEYWPHEFLAVHRLALE